MPKEKKCKKVDYIIVGAGAAGCLLARKLSDDFNNSVICLEAGENLSAEEMIKDSVFAGIEFGLEQEAASAYLYVQRPVNNGSLSRIEKPGSVKVRCSYIQVPNFDGIPGPINPSTVGIYSTGKLLGGGSAINGFQYVRGTPSLYSTWESVTDTSIWNPNKIINQFKKMENYNGETPNPNAHGFKGDLNIRQAPKIPTNMAIKATTAISEALNVSIIPDDDYNNPDTPIGSFNKWELFQNPDTTRCSSDVAFLNSSVMTPQGKGVNGRKLRVLFKTTALRIIFDGNKAVGITALRNGKFIEIKARKKVILCCGIFSSELAQRSGIGPSNLLNCLKIPVVYANPNVGLNFTNHTIVPIIFTANPNDKGVPDNDPAALYTGGAFLPPLLLDDDKNIRGYQFIGASPAPGMYMIIIIYLQPKSKGKIRIQSTDPLTNSLVDNNYFGNPKDLEAYKLAIRQYILPIADKLAEIDPQYQLISPSRDVIANDDKLKEYIFDNFDHTHHWMGSNKMSTSPKDGVVNCRGEVFGVENLIIADDSIAPVINDGNTCSSAYCIAMTIADAILNE